MTSERELHEYYWPNSQLRFQGTYVNGKQHGECKSWYKNGQLWSQRTYVNGVRHGECKGWDENGQLLSLETYVNGKKHEGKKHGEWMLARKRPTRVPNNLRQRNKLKKLRPLKRSSNYV